MRRALALTLVLGAAALCPARAADPVPSIDQRFAQIKDLRAKIADLQKQERAAADELRAELKRLQDEWDKLNPPGPGPAPKPPEPPPPPADPLRAKLKAAYDADPAPADKRRERARDLAELYRQGAKLAADEAVASSGALLEQIGRAAAALLGDPPGGRKNLADVRRAANAELAALLPTDDALTGDQRKAVADLFARLATIIEEVAK